MIKSYTVFYTAEYDVQAENEDDAMQIALEQHAHLPDGSWEVVLDTEQTEG